MIVNNVKPNDAEQNSSLWVLCQKFTNLYLLRNSWFSFSGINTENTSYNFHPLNKFCLATVRRTPLPLFSLMTRAQLFKHLCFQQTPFPAVVDMLLGRVTREKRQSKLSNKLYFLSVMLLQKLNNWSKAFNAVKRNHFGYFSCTS